MLKRFPLNDQTLWIEPQTSKVKIPLLHDLRFDTRRVGLNKTKTTPLSSLKWTYEGFYHFWLKNKFECKLLVHALHMTSPANIYFFILSQFRSTSMMIILSFRNKESLLKRHRKSWDQRRDKKIKYSNFINCFCLRSALWKSRYNNHSSRKFAIS